MKPIAESIFHYGAGEIRLFSGIVDTVCTRTLSDALVRCKHRFVMQPIAESTVRSQHCFERRATVMSQCGGAPSVPTVFPASAVT
jgi:hypothetical protein